jgi:hypothetical protein
MEGEMVAVALGAAWFILNVAFISWRFASLARRGVKPELARHDRSIQAFMFVSSAICLALVVALVARGL